MSKIIVFEDVYDIENIDSITYLKKETSDGYKITNTDIKDIILRYDKLKNSMFRIETPTEPLVLKKGEVASHFGDYTRNTSHDFYVIERGNTLIVLEVYSWCGDWLSRYFAQPGIYKDINNAYDLKDLIFPKRIGNAWHPLIKVTSPTTLTYRTAYHGNTTLQKKSLQNYLDVVTNNQVKLNSFNITKVNYDEQVFIDYNKNDCFWYDIEMSIKKTKIKELDLITIIDENRNDILVKDNNVFVVYHPYETPEVCVLTLDENKLVTSIKGRVNLNQTEISKNHGYMTTGKLLGYTLINLPE